MTFKQLSQYIQKIEKVSSRLQITEILADLFEKLKPEEYEKTVYLLLGRLTPKYKTLNFGMAEKMVIRSIASAIQIDPSEFIKKYKQSGDIGETTQEYKKEQSSMPEATPEIIFVFEVLETIARASGEGSQDTKISLLSGLIQTLDPLSARYVVRIPLGVLRLGFSDMTVIDALSWMYQGDKGIRPEIQKAYHVHPDLGVIGRKLKESGLEEVMKIEPQLFTPILMMRAERLSSGQEIIEQIGKCGVEPKFDGFRLQVHKKGLEVRLYTRGLDDATFMYPDVVEAVRAEITAQNVIIEGEAIGYDVQTGNFLPFQETVQRKRKYDIEEKAKEIPLKLFVFELLYLEGKNFVSEPFSDRRKALKSIIDGDNNHAEHGVILAEEQIIDDPAQLEIMFEDAITKGLEGIVAKKLDGTYQPGARGWNWIKFKRSYSSKIDDTIDCVVMGYDYGKGKRTQFGIGAFLAGIYDEERGMYLTIAKIGTGLTDDEWRRLQAQGSKLKVQMKPKEYDVDKLMDVDVWITPEIVVEVKADEISRSPVHTAGKKLKQSKSGNAFEVEVAGFALRFPRLERFRDDKTPTDATTLKEVGKMFDKQRE
ncbi:MAG: ATP-dependent DNA ligase [Candidatus Roizmanbacteria bacterium]|nr:ATP-dependent DNA ligase [Candidatus Roizmanbacteria bacterium]